MTSPNPTNHDGVPSDAALHSAPVDDSLDRTFPESRGDALQPRSPAAGEDHDGLPRIKVDHLQLHHDRDLLLAKMFGGERDPAKIGRYEILAKLGSGGMGVVYKAHDPKLNRNVAIKLITKDDARMRERFRREAQAVAKVKHPNVIEVYDTDYDENGRPYMAMEHIDGQTLKEWLQSPRDIYEIFKVFASASRGLAVVHDEGIVHHDFKPENVLVGKDGRVRVADFGLARASINDDNPLETHQGHDALSVNITQSGAVVGTLAYMAPELLLSDDARGNVRSDQFAFCASLYEALSGERLFRTKDKNFAEIREEILLCQVKPFPRAKKIPRRVEAAIRKGLSVRPEDRHESMTDLTDLLKRMSRRPERRRWFTWAAIMLISLLTIVGAFVTFNVIIDRSSEIMDLEDEQGQAGLDGWARRVRRPIEQVAGEIEEAKPVVNPPIPPFSQPEPLLAPDVPAEEAPQPTPSPVPPKSKSARLGKSSKADLVEVKLHAGDFDTTIFDFGPRGERTISMAETIELEETKVTVKCREYDANDPRPWMEQTLDLGTGKRTITCVKEFGPRLQ